MKTKLSFSLILVFLLIFISSFGVFADDFQNVNIRIISFDRIIAENSVQANSVIEALNNLSLSDNLKLSLNPAGEKYIASIDGVQNGRFSGNDGWSFFVLRDGDVLTDTGLYNEGILPGDEITVFYGEKSKTKILKSFTHQVSGNEISFFAGALDDTWVKEGNEWVLNKNAQPVSGMRINLRLPNGNYKILSTDKEGKASTNIYQTGIYEFNGEGFVSGQVPKVTPSEKDYFLYGIENKNAVTRGEAAAFLVNTFGIKPGDLETVFEDVKEGGKNYAEIMTASSNGIISGRGEGLFAPDETVKAYEFCVMLNNILKLEAESDIVYENVPDWAQASVNATVNEGLIDYDAHRSLDATEDMLLSVYLNK